MSERQAMGSTKGSAVGNVKGGGRWVERGLVLLCGALLCGAGWQVVVAMKNDGTLRVDEAFMREAQGAEKVETISHGEAVDVEEHAAARGQTIVMFTADWCGACKAMKPTIMDYVEGDADRYLRIVDMTDRNESGAAAQYNVRFIPYLMLFEDGEEQARGTEEVMEALGM